MRDFLRRAGHFEFAKHGVANFFKVSERKAAAILREMMARAWIEHASPPGDAIRGRYKVAPLGKSLALARAVPPITREKASRMLAEFLGRVADVNARAELTHYVEAVGVFGSYNKKNAEDLGDIDICLELRERKIPGRDLIQYNYERASRSGWDFRNIAEHLGFGETEVRRLLQARNPYLSFHDRADLKRIGARAKVVFRYK